MTNFVLNIVLPHFPPAYRFWYVLLLLAIFFVSLPTPKPVFLLTCEHGTIEIFCSFVRIVNSETPFV